MNKKLIILDESREISHIENNIYYLFFDQLNNYNRKNIYSCSQILEENKIFYKKKFLKLYNLYYKKIWKNSKLNKIFLKNFDYFFISNLSQSSCFTENNIYLKILKLLVIISFIKKNKFDVIELKTENKSINLFLKKFFKKKIVVIINNEKNLNFGYLKEFKKFIFIIKTILESIVVGSFIKNIKLKKNIFFDIFINFDFIYKNRLFKSNYWGPLGSLLEKNKTISMIHFFYPTKKINNLFAASSIIENIKNNHLIFENFFCAKSFLKFIFLYFYFFLSFLFKKKEVFIKKSYILSCFDIILKPYIYDSFLGSNAIKNIYFKLCMENFFKKLKKNHKFFYIMENQNWEIMLNFFVKKYKFTQKTYAFPHHDINFWNLNYDFYRFMPVKYQASFILSHSSKIDSWFYNLKNDNKLALKKNIESVKFFNLLNFIYLKNYRENEKKNFLVFLNIDNTLSIELLNLLKNNTNHIFYVKSHPGSKNEIMFSYFKNYKNIFFITDNLEIDFKYGSIIFASGTNTVLSAYYNDIKFGIFISGKFFNLSPLEKFDNYFYNQTTFENFISAKKNKFYKKSNNLVHNFNKNLNNWKALLA